LDAKRRSPGWKGREEIKKYINAFITKFLLFAPVFGVVLPMFSKINTADSVIAAFLATAASFLIADLYIYPKYGNVPAVAADALVTAIVVLEALYLKEVPLSAPGLALVTVLIAAGEWYYHAYLGRVLFKRGW
jgi:DMSO reductase anchor subunit